MAQGHDSSADYQLPSYDFGGQEEQPSYTPQQPVQQPQAPAYVPQHQAPQAPYYPSYQPQPNPQAPTYAPQYPQQATPEPQAQDVESIVQAQFVRRELTDIGKQTGFLDAQNLVSHYDMLITHAQQEAAITGDRTKADAGQAAINLFSQGRNKEAVEILTKTFGYGPLHKGNAPQPQTQTFGSPPNSAGLQTQSGKMFKTEADYDNFRLYGNPEQIRQAKIEMDKWAQRGELPWDEGKPRGF